jgi:hypothetical protein
MKRLFTSLLAAIGVTTSAQAPKPTPSNPIAELRAMALGTKPSDLGLPAADFAKKPWGLLMETGMDGGAVYSLVVLADGSTSLYFSNGGGVVGSGSHESVRAASKAMLEVAARHQSGLKPTLATPQPKPGMVQFYVLTQQGTLAYSAEEHSLGNNKDSHSELFHAGHAVIAQVRLAQEAQAKEQAR